MKPDYFIIPSVSKRHIIIFLISILFIFTTSASIVAQEETALADSMAVDSVALAGTPLPALNITAEDTPHDGGGHISVIWDASPDDVEGGKVWGY